MVEMYSGTCEKVRDIRIPPCPAHIMDRTRRTLWAKTAMILSLLHPMRQAKIRALEEVFSGLIAPPYPSPSNLARRARKRAGRN